MNNPKSLWAFLVILPFVLGGCFFTTGPGGGVPPPGGGGPSSGDVTFTWTFGGGTCATLPTGSYVVVAIPGQTLGSFGSLPPGQYPCTVQGYDGIVFQAFAPGTYSYTIDGYDSGGNHLAAGSGTFVVNGSVTVNTDLTLLLSSATLTWTFPQNSGVDATCATAGSYGSSFATNTAPLYVDVSIDSAAFQRYACPAGNGGSALQLTGLTQGTHSITLNAVSSASTTYSTSDQILFTATVNPTVTATATPVVADFAYAVGGTEVSWDLTNGSTTQTCAQAGISTVWVNFKGASGVLYGSEGDVSTWFPLACADSGGVNQIIAFPALPPDTYQILMEGSATTSGGAPMAPFYAEPTGTPPSVGVTTAQFPTTATVVTLYLSP